MPTMNIRRLPSTSPMRPPSSRKPPKVTAYAVTTHWMPVFEKCSELWIEGSATVTIDTSSTVMKNATQITASARHRRGSGLGARALQRDGGHRPATYLSDVRH